MLLPSIFNLNCQKNFGLVQILCGVAPPMEDVCLKILLILCFDFYLDFFHSLKVHNHNGVEYICPWSHIWSHGDLVFCQVCF